MNHDESVIQAQIVSALSLMGIFVFMVPNDAAGKITPAKAGRLKAMGLRAGISDLVLVGKDGRAHFLEVKTEKGKLSESQKRFCDYCQSMGWHYAIARSVDHAMLSAKTWHLIQ